MERLTPSQAATRIKNYCAYQERCHSEVRNKLFSFGLSASDVDEIITDLIAQNFLNEERYAIQFAGGKFRLKYWGRKKIERELKFKGVSDYCIRKSVNSINETEYEKIFLKLAEQKKQSLRSEKNIFIKKRKIQDFLLSKGYELELISDFLKKT